MRIWLIGLSFSICNIHTYIHMHTKASNSRLGHILQAFCKRWLYSNSDAAFRRWKKIEEIVGLHFNQSIPLVEYNVRHWSDPLVTRPSKFIKVFKNNKIHVYRKNFCNKLWTAITTLTYLENTVHKRLYETWLAPLIFVLKVPKLERIQRFCWYFQTNEKSRCYALFYSNGKVVDI